MRRRSLAILASLVMGASALVVAAPASAAPPDRGSDGVTYVALGDSYAAGTGNLPYVDSACLRSRKAYPVQLARTLGTDVVSVACASASTDTVIRTQLGVLGPDTELVTITAGVNNLGWQTVITECRAGGDPVRCAHAQAAVVAALAEVPAEIARMLAAVRLEAPNAAIYVAGYPELFGALTSGVCTTGGLTFTAAETQFVNQGLLTLNAAIAAGVAGYVGATGDTGVTYVDVTQHFDGHGLCDTGDKWISGAVSGQRTADRTFHLNPPGMREYAEVLAGAIEG